MLMVVVSRLKMSFNVELSHEDFPNGMACLSVLACKLIGKRFQASLKNFGTTSRKLFHLPSM